MSIPGKPMLPYITRKLEIPYKIRVKAIGISKYTYSIQFVSNKIVPAPEPLFYMANSKSEFIYKESADVYLKNQFFPGKILDYYVGEGLGKTIITLHVFPIQYNPVTGQLLVFNNIEVAIDYEELYPFQSAGRAAILTTSSLKDIALTLGEFYNETIGITTHVLTIEQIFQEYRDKLAENITEYPGFYNPLQKDEVYETLKKNYNWTLALAIIAYLRNQSDIRHLLIIGGADEIPPSFYYQSEMLRSWESWIPTDYFYSSPDYDLYPNIYVGRIPFNSASLVQAVIDKISRWYNATSTRPDWLRKLTISGGAPFGTILMFGEAAASEATMRGFTKMFNTMLLTLTDENYNVSSIQSIFRDGNVGWFFAICHGSGDSLVDVINGSYEQLILNNDLLSYSKNDALPVVSSVACMNGAWDDDLLDPPFFTEPPFGKAVLMSQAGGIAYLGSARPAFELGIMFTLQEGMLKTSFYGATMLHLSIIKAYNSFLGTESTVSLGEVVAKGCEDFLETTIPTFENNSDFYLTNLFMLSLLGDPFLQLPTYSNEFSKATIEEATACHAYDSIDMLKLFLCPFINGTAPFYKLPSSIKLEVKGNDTMVKVKAVQMYILWLWAGWPSYDGFKVVTEKSVPLINGKAEIEFTEAETLLTSGLGLFKIKTNGVEARFYIVSAGLTLQPKETFPGSIINVKAYGLNLEMNTHILTVGGWNVSSIYVPTNGSASYSFVLPTFPYGIYKVKIYPPAQSPISKFFEENVTVLPAIFGVMILAGDHYEPNENITMRIMVFLGENLTDPISIQVKFNDENLTIQRVGIGEFLARFQAPSEPGTYFIKAEATIYYGLEAFTVKAFAAHTLTVSESHQKLQDLINQSLAEIERVNENVTKVIMKLGNINITLNEIVRLTNDASNNIIAEVETNYGLLNMSLQRLNGTIVKVSNTTVEIRTILGVIQGEIIDVNGNTVAIKTAVGNIQTSIENVEYEKIPTAMNYLYALLGASLCTLAISVYGIFAKRRKE